MTDERRVSAQRGPQLRCKGWRQEAILRLLENTLENAEGPDPLVVYGGSFVAARDWTSYEHIRRALKRLEEHETLVVQSGKPVGIFTTGPAAPLVVMANGITVGATESELQGLLSHGLTARPGMTAGAWQYIGSQGIVQGTYETFMQVARERFDGTLEGRTIVTGGCGGMSGAQPFAGKLAGAATLVAEVREDRLDRRLREGYLDQTTADIGDAIDRWQAMAARSEAGSVGVAANVVDLLGEIDRRRLVPDIVTDQTTTDPLYGYIPVGCTPGDCDRLRGHEPERLVELSRETLAEHVRLLVRFLEAGSIVFEYGNGLRDEATRAGVSDALRIPGFVDLYIRPYFCEGIGPFRMVAIQGEPETIWAIDALLAEEFAQVPRVWQWLEKARQLHFTGLPARVCWLGHAERTRAALAVNELIAHGEIAGPVAFTRDHLDSGSVTSRYRETENMRDGSDCVADWPILCALLDAVAGADLVAVHGLWQRSLNSGPTVIADGTAAAAERLRRVFDADTGLGVIRHADAGYQLAVTTRDRYGLGLDSPRHDAAT